MYTRKSRKYEILKAKYEVFLQELTDEFSKPFENLNCPKIDYLINILESYQFKMLILLKKESFRNRMVSKKQTT